MNTQRLMFLYGALNKIIELEFDISQAPFIASTSTLWPLKDRTAYQTNLDKCTEVDVLREHSTKS